MRKRIFRIIGIVFVLVVVSLLVYVFTRTPSNDRDWLPEYARMATTETRADGTVSIRDVRDWSYGDGVVRSTDWVTLTVDPEDIVRVWFVIEPFGAYEGVGHTFLSFERKDGSGLTFSIQARQENGESYSALSGLANQFELASQWGTDRDFIGRRLLYLGHELRMYPLTISAEDARALFKTLIKETNDLAVNPRFYNTLGENCTNTLVEIVNRKYPGTLPYGISWNLTGYADLYLMRHGFIKAPDGQDETRMRANLTPHKDAILDVADESNAVFSRTIRALVAPTL